MKVSFFQIGLEYLEPLSAKASVRLIAVCLLAFWGLVFVCLLDPTRKLFGW